MVDYISSTCRICLMEGNRKISLFESPNESYSDLIKEYVGTDVIENANLPSSICEVCSKELMVLVKFVSNFRLSTIKLKDKSYNKVSLPNASKQINILPLDENNVDIKEEKINCEIDTSDHFYASDRSDEESSDSKFIPQYRIAKSTENGLKKDMVECLTCGLLVQNKSAFIVHNRKHTGEKPCKCMECGKCFTQVGSLNDHIRKHHLKESLQKNGALADAVKKMRLKDKFGEYRFTCDACGKRFWKKGALTIHLRVHTREKPYRCLYCPKRFPQYSEHLQHTRIHTGERPYSCNICGKKFISHSPLKRHLSVHSDERKYKCQICGTAVKSSYSLKKHMLMIHTYEKRNICELCGAGFAMKYNLKSHMKARHSERSGDCDICKKSFSNLSKHMNTHSAVKPFGCHMCIKRFFRQKSLEAHLIKHQDETPSFSCSIENCQSVFSKQSKLDFHVLKYHTNHTPHICQFCSKGFYRLADLRKHIKSIHDKCNELSHAPNNMVYL